MLASVLGWRNVEYHYSSGYRMRITGLVGLHGEKIHQELKALGKVAQRVTERTETLVEIHSDVQHILRLKHQERNPGEL